MKANNTYNVVIANEACNFTSTKYNTTLTGFTSSEAASNAAREALRDIAGEMGKGEKVFYSETLNAWILASASRRFTGSVWLIVAKIEEATETNNTTPDNTTPTTVNTMNTETAPANVIVAITTELNARSDISAWNKAVTAYALELIESLDGWGKQPASVAELRKMMLNGADNWGAYSWGGSSLIYNWDIAERCCNPSELKRVTRKDGSLRDMANAREHWLDVQARALYQAANRVANIAAKYFNA